jgi:SNF2 family DNA or RNA helicase
MGATAFCELDARGKRIEVHFKYDPVTKEAVKMIPGSRAVYEGEKFKHWTVPLDMECAQMLRNIFGPGLTLGDAVRAWGQQARAAQRNLSTLAVADDAELQRLPGVLPELAEFLRPYQRADTAFMAATSVGNFNQPGLGKTVETIAAIYEAGLEDGPQLVIAPATSLDTVWKFEYEKWTDMPVVLLSGDYKLSSRAEAALIKAATLGGSFVLVTTPAQIRKGLPGQICKLAKWKTVSIDEFHKSGATNVSGDPSKGTQFGRALRDIQRERIWFISGTPMGGKPIKLWGILNHVQPDKFTSKWRWAETWLEVDEGYGGSRTIGDLLKNRVDEFYPAHAQYFVRRLKKEVLSQLPDKQYVEVWCDMLPAQARQYAKMNDDAEVRINEERLSAKGILAEMTRLKQFANAECDIEVVGYDDDGRKKFKLHPKASGKLQYLLDRLDERGIRPSHSRDGLEPEGDEVAVVASQSEEMVSWLHDELNSRGIKTEKITGKVNQKQRADLVKRFQSGKDSPRVIVMTTTAGGVAITLDRADSVHLIDETFNPDDQEQVEDRIHRISRIHQVTCYYYRSKGTIEETIYRIAGHKKMTNAEILDVQRQAFKEAA